MKTLPLSLCLCGLLTHSAMSSIEKSPFGKTSAGEEASLYTLKNSSGASVTITDFGGTVVSINVPDRDRNLADISLGFDSVEGYEGDKNPYFGCITGRYANRIAKGKFSIAGEEFTLATNNDPNHLHGGDSGFNRKMWEATIDGNKLVFSRTSPDGEEGYPGALACKITYTFTDDNALHIDYEATTNKPTVLNLTNHTYFNLGGEGSGTILDHVALFNCSHFTPTDDTAIPYGEVRPVKGTPFDFTTEHTIGERINQTDNEQIKFGLGYDHNFVIDSTSHGSMVHACTVTDPASGRVLEVHTDQPGVQFYTGNFLDGLEGKGGKKYDHRTGFCLETQIFPDSPNNAHFPSPVLRPGETYTHKCVYKFRVKE
ncbi:MAG: aldose epimerase family protein [Verrucomicrobiota bacterium]